MQHTSMGHITAGFSPVHHKVLTEPAGCCRLALLSCKLGSKCGSRSWPAVRPRPFRQTPRGRSTSRPCSKSSGWHCYCIKLQRYTETVRADRVQLIWQRPIDRAWLLWQVRGVATCRSNMMLPRVSQGLSPVIQVFHARSGLCHACVPRLTSHGLHACSALC